ncbi:21451_t:CDS:2 [Gigaspora rosea]|nr:21451_t:CDS:2 [Gigaspora rosea]
MVERKENNEPKEVSWYLDDLELYKVELEVKDKPADLNHTDRMNDLRKEYRIKIEEYKAEEKYKERRIVVSNNRNFQDSDKKFNNLSESRREAQNIGCAIKWWSGSEAKRYEIGEIRKDDSKINKPL